MKLTNHFLFTILVLFINCNSINSNKNTITENDSNSLNTEIAKQFASQTKVFAFKNVNLIPMTSDTLIEAQTVLIRDGIIEGIFDANSAEISKEYQIIDGTGSYLMPGLADMHTHIREANDLYLNVFNGVTTVLDMGGPPGILELRARMKNEEIIGPQIFASVFVDGKEPTYWLADGSETAEEVVLKFKRDGWDFIKVYNSVAESSFYSLIAEGEKNHISIIGHGVRDVGLKDGLLAGQKMVAHAEEYLYSYFDNNLDVDLMAEIVKVTAESGAYLTANLSTYETINNQWSGKFDSFLEQTLNRPEAKFLNQKTIDSWRKSRRYANRFGNLDEQFEFLKLLTKEMHKAGVPLLLGTDSPSPDIVGMFPGFTIHDDLRTYSKAGLSNYEVLRTGTQTAGVFIKENVSKDILFGVIEKGFRADLILLEDNPLLDLDHVKKLQGVMLNGLWLDRKKLDSLLPK